MLDLAPGKPGNPGGAATRPLRVAAVRYLNTRPLIFGLASRPDLFTLHFDVPSRCASLLHDGAVDLAMLSAIEYTRRPDYRIVHDIAVASRGRVVSVALFTTRRVADIQSIALDSSSRTAAALLRILCAERFLIEPEFVTMRPDLQAMLETCDAALLIGDAALFAEHDGAEKIDLGEEWTGMTGLPFIWSFWAGREAAIQPAHVHALVAARNAGTSSLDTVAATHQPTSPARADIVRTYLRKHLRFSLTEDGRAGLERYFASAAGIGIASEVIELKFFSA